MGDISKTIADINENIKIANDRYASMFNNIADQVNKGVEIAKPYASDRRIQELYSEKSIAELTRINDDFAKIIINIHRIMAP